MAMYGEHPPLKLAKDPSNPVWHWFICNGPHGERFNWAKESNMPKDLMYLEKFISEKSMSDIEFASKLRDVAIQSLDIENIAMIRKAIQVLCVVGTEEDMELVKEFIDSDYKEIVIDAKCCLFERRIKLKK